MKSLTTALALIFLGTFSTHASDLSLSFSGSKDYSAYSLTVRVVEAESRQVVAKDYIGKLKGAHLHRTVQGLQAGYEYYVEVHVDKDGDGAYDAPPVDASWRIATGVVESKVIQLSLDMAEEPMTNLGWNSPKKSTYTVTFDGMEAYKGYALHVRLVKESMTDGVQEYGYAEVKSIPSGEFSVAIPLELEPQQGQAVTLEVCVDKDGDGYYDGGHQDVGWGEVFRYSKQSESTRQLSATVVDRKVSSNKSKYKGKMLKKRKSTRSW